MKPATPLSVREAEVAALYAAGATYHLIAEQLLIAPATVRSHLAAIYRKLKLSSKLELKARLDGDFAEAHPQIDQATTISELALRLEEGIYREKALSAVLRIISSSNGDLSAVIPAILGYAVELCDADFGILMEYRQNGAFYPLFTKGLPEKGLVWLMERGEFTPDPATGLGRMGALREVVNVIDMRTYALDANVYESRDIAIDLGGVRSMVAIPMLAGDELVGAFVMFRTQVWPFTDDLIRLASIFAEQSVIAIKNAQLISALRETTHADDSDKVLA